MRELMPIERPIRVEALYNALDVVREAGFYFSGESHDFWELVYVCSGTATATADERVYYLESGMLLFHRPMEFHRIWSEGENGPHLMIVSCRISGSDMARLEKACLALSPGQRKRFESMAAVLGRARQLYDGGHREEARLSAALGAAMLEGLLLRLLSKEELPGWVHSDQDAQYTQIVQTMKQNCCRSLSLQELAEQCGLSVSNMKRIFRKFSDMGIAKYFLFLKMQRAMELLDQGLAASAVAEQLDFSETGYFYTVFKRETGMTPAQYRRSRQEP